MSVKKVLPLTFCLLMIASTAFSRTKHPEILLAPQETIPENPYFQKAVKISGELQSKTEIQYLIARIRESKYPFIRNKETHTAEKAAKHIAWKYSKAAGKIKTPRDFIDHIASKSIISGEIYAVIIGGELYPMKEILYNELSILEELKKKSPSGNPRKGPDSVSDQYLTEQP